MASKLLEALSPTPWVLPPLSNSWITIIIWLYIALNRTPNIDCYWVGAVPNLYPRFRTFGAQAMDLYSTDEEAEEYQALLGF